jgi:hypothetical protein
MEDLLCKIGDFRLHSARCKTLGCMVSNAGREAIKSKMRDCRLQSAGCGTGGYIYVEQDAGL